MPEDQQPPESPPSGGLKTPHGGALAAMESPARARAPWRLGLQLVGAAIGVALAYWAVSLAFGGENRESVERLRQAGAGAVLGILGLSVVTISLNGVLFWVALRPLEQRRRVRPLRVVLINTIPTLLAVLPFKLGFVVRVGLHHRLDRLSLKTLAAWMAAFAALALAVFVPAGVAGLIAEGPLWWALLALGPAAGLASVYALARLATRIGVLHRLMLGAEAALTDVRTLIATYALRMVDIGVQGARFALAAHIVGLALTPGEALLLGASYFLVVAVAPAGALGFAEAITGLVAAAVGLDKEGFLLVALVVSGAHYGGALLMAIPSAIILRPDRILRPQPERDPSLPSDEWA